MSITLKENEDYVSCSGATWSDAYGVVEDIILDSKAKRATFNLKIYYDSTAQSNNKAYQAKQFEIEGDDYDTYFAESVLDDADKTPFSQAEAYVLAQDNFSIWQ